MEHPDDTIRALAASLSGVPDISRLVPDEASAAKLFLRGVLRDECPVCGARDVTLVDHRSLRCRECREVSWLTASTGLRGTRVSLRHWCAAVWHVFVDSETVSARAFARRYALRIQTAWRLLHRVREALVHARPQERGRVVQVLGRNSPNNVAYAHVSIEGPGVLTAIADDAIPGDDEPVPAEVALWLGRLRAWLCDVFRGVKRRYLNHYLAEFAARFGRVETLEEKLERSCPSWRNRGPRSVWVGGKSR